MELITWLVIGLIAGWLAGLVANGSGYAMIAAAVAGLALTTVAIIRDLDAPR